MNRRLKENHPQKPLPPKAPPKPREKLFKKMSANFDRLEDWFRSTKREVEAYEKELRAVREENERLRGIYADFYESGPVGYLTLNKAGIIKEINPTGACLLGAPKVHLLQTPLLIHLAEEDCPPFLIFLSRIFKNPADQTCEVRVRKKKGDPLWLGLRSMATKSPEGHLKEARMSLFDITDRKRLEEALRRAEKRLRDLDSIPKTPGG